LATDPDGVLDGLTTVDVTSGGVAQADFGFVEPIDLSITKTAPSAVEAGESITWHITVANEGTTTARAPIVVTDTLPLSIDPITVSGDLDCDIVAKTVTCTSLRDLAPGDDLHVSVVTATSDARSVVNEVVVAGDPTQTDTNLADNSATAVVDVGTLPRTGQELFTFVVAGFVFLLFGALLLTAGRKEDQATPDGRP
jgi:uncharacterized repeat protein (TIGR01451 family)/LPXTG-motif cell wall-anchored protein